MGVLTVTQAFFGELCLFTGAHFNAASSIQHHTSCVERMRHQLRLKFWNSGTKQGYGGQGSNNWQFQRRGEIIKLDLILILLLILGTFRAQYGEAKVFP